MYRSIPAQPRVLTVPLLCFHQCRIYLEHHDYHIYIQSHLCPTWKAASNCENLEYTGPDIMQRKLNFERLTMSF